MEKPRILIVDDDAGLRKTLSDILKVKGYDSFAAGNGADGLTLLKEQPVNLMLIDLGLPDISGLDLLDRVKADHPGVEAIVLTGNATLDSAIEATNRGAFSYVLKPFDVDNLLLLARRAIEKQQAEAKILRHNLKLERINAELKVLYEVSRAISQTLDLKELVAEVLKALIKTEIFPFEIKGAIYLVEDGRMDLASFIGIPEAALDTCEEVHIGRCLCGQAVATGETVVSSDSSEDEQHVLHHRGREPHGHIIVPLRAVDKVVGLINLYTEPGTEVSDRHRNLFASLGNQIGIAINNARLYEETKTFSLHDPLTGLGNRRLMETQLEKCFDMARRYDEALSLVMIDIDHFKHYNDTQGHLAGDQLLTMLAKILLREVRRADYVFRYGGEEFLVLLPETGPERAQEAAERLRKTVEAEAGVTISLGVAHLEESPSKPEQLIAHADRALYRAKQNGRNRVETGS
jgi:diguanylate cyclase (GGDEF)-like protein